MRPVRLLFIYLLIVFLGGALLAPWLYALTQTAAAQFTALRDIADNPFHRYVNRSMLALALIGLWPFLRGLGMNNPSALGLSSGAARGRLINSGFWLGFGSLAVVAAINLLAGARTLDFDDGVSKVAGRMVSAGLTAVVVATLEEIIFRGALFGALRRVYRWPIALALSSMVYALVHFFSKPQSPEVVDWPAGLVVLGGMLRGFVEFQALIPGFLTLTVAGMILGLAYQRSGSLWMSIGLHAGWIFWLKFYGAITDSVPDANTWLWGTGKLINGWLAFVVLAVMMALLWPRARQASASSSKTAGESEGEDD